MPMSTYTCKSCESRSGLTAKPARRDKAPSSVKRNLAIATAGTSLLVTGLSKKGPKQVQVSCSECNSTYIETFDAFYGAKLVSGIIGLHEISLYENGWVRVRLAGLGFPEQLRSISGESHASMKTGIGRGLAAVATGGLNMVGGVSKLRGTLNLTIVTSDQVHTISKEGPTPEEVAALQRIVAVGQTLQNDVAVTTPNMSAAHTTTIDSIPEQISALAQLRDSGAITEDEFQSKKTELLGRI